MMIFSVDYITETHLKKQSANQNLISSGCDSETAKKLKFTEIPLTGQNNYAYLQQTCSAEKMQTFRDFLRWFKRTDVVPTVEAMKKKIQFIPIRVLTFYIWVVRFQT